ncbi:MAG: 16S rRNA (guanine(527)-N(7))-methyltransferase RsmG [Actinomycetota bacterium]
MKQSGDRRTHLESAARDLGVALPAHAFDALISYADLLKEKAIPLGFVARSDEHRLVERHVIDSLRVAAEIEPTDRTALDLGSGAGLPGIVVAVAAPRLRVRLVESHRRRVAFLELAVERLGLANAEVVAERAESLETDPTDLCTARAFAPLNRAWIVARRLLSDHGRLIYFAGSRTSATAPEGARIVATRPAPLESSGALVIMAR